MSIFVNIAAYDDPELLPTILDCICKAANPSELHFGICWQRRADDNSMWQFANHKNFRIEDVLASDSKGCCWARAKSQSLYNGEDYVLQLDSHHRFEHGWDKTMVAMLEGIKCDKPMLTGYVG